MNTVFGTALALAGLYCLIAAVLPGLRRSWTWGRWGQQGTPVSSLGALAWAAFLLLSAWVQFGRGYGPWLPSAGVAVIAAGLFDTLLAKRRQYRTGWSDGPKMTLGELFGGLLLLLLIALAAGLGYIAWLRQG